MPRLGLLHMKKIGSDLRRLTTKECRDSLSEVIEFTSQTKNPVIITNYGKDRAAIVPLGTIAILERIDRIAGRSSLNNCKSAESTKSFFVNNYVTGLHEQQPTTIDALLLI